MEGRLASALGRGLMPDEVLDYYAERSNGVTSSVSRPVKVEARSVDDAAERMLARSKAMAWMTTATGMSTTFTAGTYWMTTQI